MKKKPHPASVIRTFQRMTLLLAACLFSLLAYSQQLLVNPGMEDSTGWTIYHQGSAFPASYQFNYTGDLPAAGRGGCLRVTSAQRTNILFWQKLRLQAGKAYVVDGAIKTGPAASFWCELYLSTIAPNPNADYSPNNNTDVIRGFSTWAGCGPNVNGTFALNGCSGKAMYTVPGTDTAGVDVYFAVKTGTSATTLPAPLEVLIDELRVSLLQDENLLRTREGSIDSLNKKVIDVSPFITVEQFRAGLHAAATATIEIVGNTGGQPIVRPDTARISDTMSVRVRGTNATNLYAITLRDVSTGNQITHVPIGVVDPFHARLWVPFNARVAQLRSAIRVAAHASFTIVDSTNTAAPALSYLNNTMKVLVTAESGAPKTYRISTLPIPMWTQTWNNKSDSLTRINNKIITLKGSSVITITAATDPLKGSLLDLRSDDIWLYFPHIKPSVFYVQYLPQIMVNGAAAVPDTNIRVDQYLQGTVVISHSNAFKALQVFDGEHQSGNTLQLGNYTYYRRNELGALHDAIKSFRLKKGYMATFAKDSLGTGYSRVYVADKTDIIIDSLPVGLYNDVSFVRVIPWRWVSKKGWTSGRDMAEALNCSWQYDWDNVAVSGLNVEYIPMRHNRYWNAFDNINNKKKSTHALGFNEPERPDQANMSVADAIALWPELMKSGLRLGSPSPSDGGLEWLYQFIDRCDALNYRVDFIAMHWYMGGQTPQQFYDRMKQVHERTGRPIWVTEWNNGANWTCCKPTYPQQAEAIAKFLHMLDTASFVERYSLYEWVQDTRQMFYKSPVLLTPAGEVYRDHVSSMAYDSSRDFVRAYTEPPAPPVPPVEYAGVGVGFNYGRSLSVDIDNDGDLDIIYSGVDPYVGGIVKNDGQGRFTSTGQTLPGIYIPTINAGDLDGDGDLDMLFAGWDRANNWAPYARILRNDGSGTFTLETPPSINAPVGGIADLDNNGLPDYFMIGNTNNNKFYFQYYNGFDTAVNRVSNGSNIQDPDATWVDIDNDQDIDFCIEAWNRSANRRYTQVWKNNGDGQFTEQSVPFKQKAWGSAQFGDIDSDGDLDMLLNGDGDGFSDAGSHDIYRLYINDGTGNFTEGATFQNYRQNANGKGSAFVDWDNDGDYDIILTGRSSTENKEVANTYLNDGHGVFTKSAESVNLPGVNRSSIELGDFNRDGKVDVLLNGYNGLFGRHVAFMYTNVTARVNTTPQPPTGLQTRQSGDTVFFNWQAGTDAETAVQGLTYNIYVKDAAGKFYIFPNAQLLTGTRMVCGFGNAYHNLGWRLKGLPPGTYTWSVQSIDAGYAGSAFAAEGMFEVTVPIVAK